MPRCPSCFTPLTRVEEADIKSAVCGNCFGTWINVGALTRRTRLDAQAAQHNTAPPLTASLADLAAVVQESNSKETLRCPQCEKRMTKERFHPMIPVEVDRCPPCDYLWLDAGEISFLRRLYTELMISDDPEITRRRDKIATVSAQWDEHRRATGDASNLIHLNPPLGTTDPFDLLSHLISLL